MKPIRSKLSAWLLAIFLGTVTWIYSYEDDGHKFWISLIILILFGWTVFIPIIVWICVLVDTAGFKNKVSYKWV